ncbi:MAG: adenylate/guanylate cyclase domain-containing protein [Alphaproteobacteria bacterium]|nr:adenylate/guanylate cyclase domain-containing protein [Alphaproteobacteria bacterium]
MFAPIRGFLATGRDFAAIERPLTQLPLNSARLAFLLYLPPLFYRLIAPLIVPDLSPLAMVSELPPPGWTDTVLTLVIQLIFIFVVVYFLISGYLECLPTFLFEQHKVNLGLFFGRFALKIGVALFFVAVGPLTLIAGELFSYDGERLISEIAIDLFASAFGLVVTLFLVARSLTRPLGRLDVGMGKIADGELSIRLPVTSNEEIGQLTSRFNRMVEGLLERQRIRATFGKYVSESVASQLLKQTGGGRLAGETREATLMFTDIEGFTTLSEHLPPATRIAILNQYLEAVIEPIQQQGGVINSFIGDGLFASFNMPLANERHAASAIRAAAAIQGALAERVFAGNVRLTTRIGINSGTVIGGTIGAGERLTYTLLGDAVNTASRLQELNKSYGTRILITGATRRLASDGFRVRPIGEVTIRGRNDPLLIHAIDLDPSSA